MSKLLPLSENTLKLPQMFGVDEDFLHYVSTHRFTTIATDSGTATVGDAVGGILALAASDGTVADNDECYIKGVSEVYKFAASKPLFIRGRLQFTEANTDDANIIFGLMSAVAANALLDNGAGPAASYSGCVFFKVDGSTVWQAESSLAGTQTTTTLNAAGSRDGIAKTAGGSSYQTLEINWVPNDSTTGDFTFFIDGVLVAKHKGVTYTSATEMQIVAGVKNGDTNMETLNVDYISAWQVR